MKVDVKYCLLADSTLGEFRLNSTYKKLAVQWLNEALCFVANSVVSDSFVLRNRQLLVAANRYQPFKATETNDLT